MGGNITQEMVRRRSEHNECVLYTMEVHPFNIYTYFHIIIKINYFHHFYTNEVYYLYESSQLHIVFRH